MDNFRINGLRVVNLLSANPKKWPNTLKLPTNCLSVFDHVVKLALKGLRLAEKLKIE